MNSAEIISLILYFLRKISSIDFYLKNIKREGRRSRWRIHRTTIERFISVYRLEENGSLLKEGTGDAVGWALRACSYKTKTEASQQRRSRHTLQGVFLVFVFAPFSFYHFVSSSLCLFDSLSLRPFVSSSLCLFVSLPLCLFDS